MSVWRTIVGLSIGAVFATGLMAANEPTKISIGDASESNFLNMTLPDTLWSWTIGGPTVKAGQVTETVVLPACSAGEQPREGLVLKHYPHLFCKRADGVDFVEAAILDLQNRFPGAVVTELRNTPSDRYVLFRDGEKGQSGLVRLTQSPTGWFEIAYVQFAPTAEQEWFAWQEAVGQAILHHLEELTILPAALTSSAERSTADRLPHIAGPKREQAEELSADSIGPLYLALPMRAPDSRMDAPENQMEEEHRPEGRENGVWGISGGERGDFFPSGYFRERHPPVPVEKGGEFQEFEAAKIRAQGRVQHETSQLEEAIEQVLAVSESQEEMIAQVEPARDVEPMPVNGAPVISTMPPICPIVFIEAPCCYPPPCFYGEVCYCNYNPPRPVNQGRRRNHCRIIRSTVQREVGPPLFEVCCKRRWRRH